MRYGPESTRQRHNCHCHFRLCRRRSERRFVSFSCLSRSVGQRQGSTILSREFSSAKAKKQSPLCPSRLAGYILKCFLRLCVLPVALFLLESASVLLSISGTSLGSMFSRRKRSYAASEKTVLLRKVHTADPSARVLNGSVYVIASHDIVTKRNTGRKAVEDDIGTQFDMRAYRLMRFSEDMGKVNDIGDILPIDSVPWADRQLWAPDVIEANGLFFLYFPARDKADGRFKIGVAVADSPEGPYAAEPRPIEGLYSIDPGLLRTSGGDTYIYFGGLGGGELQNYATGNSFDSKGAIPASGVGIRPRVAKLKADLKSVDGELLHMEVHDEKGREMKANDSRRYFEGPFVYERNGTYYFLYSTGTSHLIVYCTSDSPIGPWRYRGVVLTPPQGWTTQVSVVEYNQQSYLFYHDAKRSGETFFRDVKFQKMSYKPNGSIVKMDP